MISTPDLKSHFKVNLKGIKFKDPEALALGPCGDRKCLFVADIGDNGWKRKKTWLYLIDLALLQFKDAEVPVLKTIELRYPDEPQDAEGFAIHPNGDGYLFTKGQNFQSKLNTPARLYRVPSSHFSLHSNFSESTLEKTGEIEMRSLSQDSNPFASLVTSFDISPNGKRFMVLTYRRAYEFEWDLSQNTFPSQNHWVIGQNVDRIRIDEDLPQQEAVSYLLRDGGNAFLVTSESAKDDDDEWVPMPLLEVICH